MNADRSIEAKIFGDEHALPDVARGIHIRPLDHLGEYPEGEGPRFEHDCAECEFLERDGIFDMYACPLSLVSGYVWRYGPADRYTTMPQQRMIWLSYPPSD